MNRLRNLFACLCPALCLLAGLARAQTVVWSDNFETNVGLRWVSTGVWKIGAPTAGPAVNNLGYRTHSGTNCVYTQNYKANTDARIVCDLYNGSNSLVIPAADQFPRLRFWHWFNFQNALGFVEISTNRGSTWTQISATFQNDSSSGVWSRPSIDLSAYAGQSVWFALRFYGSGTGNGLGWYVDDIMVETSATPPLLNFPEGFEFDPKMTEWVVDNGTWEIGRPTSGPGQAHTGTNCAATVLAGNYANYVNTRLISPYFNVPAGTSALQFWHWYNFSSALGFVEINNGSTTTTTTTTTTITTNITVTINTNIYQIFGAANTAYDTPLYWNGTIGAWTNDTQVLGSVYAFNYAEYFFEAGDVPFNLLGNGSYAYRINGFLPIPQSPHPTNFFNMHGAIWTSSIDGSDTPVGYFATNTTYTYTTNTTTTSSSTTWTQISPTYTGTSSGAWKSASVDLSAFAGQTVQVAFHFGSAAGAAPGWYVDDLKLTALPVFTVPTNLVISYGQTFTNQLTATNSVEPLSKFTFALSVVSTNVMLSTNGVLTWTNTTEPPGTYFVYPKVTDNNSPAVSVTNNFSVTVLPLPSQLVFTNFGAVTNGGHKFKFSIKTPWTNSYVIYASTNLAIANGWIPIYTNFGGSGSTLIFTDRLATNYPTRFYRAGFRN